MGDYISCDESSENNIGMINFLEREFNTYLSDAFPSLSFDKLISVAKSLPDIENKYTAYNYVSILRKKGIK